MGKVTVLVVGLFLLGALAAPAAAWSFQNSFSQPYYSSPYGSYYGNPYGSYYGSPSGSYYGNPYGSLGGLGGTDLSSIYGSSGPFGSLGSSNSYSPYSGYSSSPYSSYSSSPSSSLFSNGLFADSPFGSMFGSMFKAKTYGPPPTQNITDTLVGQRLNYNSGFMGIPLQYELEKSDIGDATGMQYQGADAWKVRVGQQGYLWDVIMDETGTKVLSVSQVQ